MLRGILTSFLLFTVLSVDHGSTQNPEEGGKFVDGDIIGNIPNMNGRSGLTNPYYRWPNGVIPFQFDAHYPGYLRDMFYHAMSHLHYYTCVRFVPRSNQRDFVQITAGNGCYSNVGRVGGRQTISLSPGCNNIGTFLHEMMHTIGFVHEQSRLDRDDYVQILWQNIIPGMSRNFDKSPGTSPFGVEYDYSSVMHYSDTAFSRSRFLKTIVPRGNPRIEIGQRRGLSHGDMRKINRMYQCHHYHYTY